MKFGPSRAILASNCRNKILTDKLFQYLNLRLISERNIALRPLLPSLDAAIGNKVFDANVHT